MPDLLETLAVQRDVYSVSRLNRETRLLLGTSFPLIWIEGELSNFATPGSGHMYFTLKDGAAAVRCAMFKNQNMYLRFRPRNGLAVLLRARVGLYEPRGEFQLTVEHMEEAGFGALQRAFELLKQKLAAEGLFDGQRKRLLPPFPRRLGVITSPVGAAIRDIVSTARRRFPAMPVIIYPSPVQGAAAAEAIAQALRTASRRKDCDVLILARGGGSLEDLWAFNTEIVARAIAACEIPVVSGIGHEIDFTIADFAVDQRAATPTAAAELTTPDGPRLLSRLVGYEQELELRLRRHRQRLGQTLEWLRGRLRQQHPRLQVQRQMQRIDGLELRLKLAARYVFEELNSRLNEPTMRLQQCGPRALLMGAAARHSQLAQRLWVAQHREMEIRRHRLRSAGAMLNAISPLKTLDRGYALVTLTDDNRVVRDSGVVMLGDALDIRLARGHLRAKVTGKTR
ncbi:MAG: exodeoxyribonuclease VII large subunit [Gammaproteobacteria bacterium]|nr:exodeoxyribonuclease VII large subunit [Gammaproteobacteria bacterium]